jgi:hypothetical protein
MRNERRPLADRFWEKVDKSDGCWLWTGATSDRGYGSVNTGGRHGPTRSTHRVAWELTHGPIPKGMVVCHSCDNPPCVRPDHLFLGTQRANLRDAAAKNRTMRGEDHVFHRLTEAQVLAIRRRHAEGTSQADLAREYGLHHQHVRNIVVGRNWRHLPISTNLGRIGDRGERHRSAKLTAEKVRAIRADPRVNHILATEYGVSDMAISNVKRRKTWGHVD